MWYHQTHLVRNCNQIIGCDVLLSISFGFYDISSLFYDIFYDMRVFF